MNARTIVVGGVLLIGVVSAYALATAQEEAPDASMLPDYSGKVLLLWTGDTPMYPFYLLESAKFKTIGGRLFLSGKYADTKRANDFRVGYQTNVAWDTVSGYQVLTKEQYNKYVDDALRQANERNEPPPVAPSKTL